MSSDPASYLVAHRGDQEAEIENTVAAFERAANAGARYIECDIQFTADFVPVVCHDNRTHTGKISELTLAELPPHIPTFAALMAWLEMQPEITLFLEIKSPVLQRRSANTVAKTLHAMIPDPLRQRIVAISMSARLVEASSRIFDVPVGWVMERGRIPDVPLGWLFFPWQERERAMQWPGKSTRTATYTVNDAKQAAALHESGIDLVETNHFCRLNQELEKISNISK